ncbi:dihydrolipoamide acetyltransferase family protein [Microbacterium sediminis]|uniref:Dihydrolipoamide acetyltransferase component of pyruvate dehydrogenase complex n=1 Tax=Microbacterium sediminis TaxID=904291 RepID=A0A1B9NA40_9MICO|nr:dihydrolipoamide acetyltransferase family protein [Microbacterium sediminis]OCG73491.1 branched-chain alpha-keto acid dehydrogenase subunit E2 [Microbacterium sediminis]QBR73159.1 2-oxo acid dehydrogenase subunit E2 [Microbacterium sediminis]
MQTYNLPDVGEGLTEAEIVQWHVKPGDTVAVNDVVAEIETAKSLVELPSPYAGTVAELLVAEGDTVDVGTPILAVAGADDQPAPTAPSDPAPAAADAGGSVLVGYGTGGEVKTRRRKPRHEVAVASSVGVVAKPPIRKLARDLGIDLADVTASGPAGEVTRDDVLRHAEQAKVFRNLETPQWPTERERRIPVAPASTDDRYETIPVKGVRKATANAMVGSAYTAPHVSVWTDVDASRTMEFVKRLKQQPQFADVRVSPLLVFAKALLWAVQRTPEINSAWVDTEQGAEIHVRNYVNLGIAAATPRGLLVPNIKDAHALSMRELAVALQNLTQTARDGKTTPEDQQGGTITITNIGVFGMDAGTPIINPGEAGIVAMGAIRQKPWVVDGEVRPAWVTTVSGSFDHRIVDGDKISRFIADIAAVLEEPALLLD